MHAVDLARSVHMPNIPCPGSAQCLPLQHPCPVQAPSCHCWRSACQVGFPLCHLHFARLHDGQTRMSRATARGQHCASPLNICAVFMQLNQVVVGKATRSTSPHLLRGQRLASLNNCTLEADLSPLASPFGVQSICLAVFPPSGPSPPCPAVHLRLPGTTLAHFMAIRPIAYCSKPSYPVVAPAFHRLGLVLHAPPPAPPFPPFPSGPSLCWYRSAR